MVSAYSHFGYVTATHTGYFPQTRHNSAAQIFYPCRVFTSCGCSRLAQENVLCGTGMPRLRGVNRLCSSTVAEMRIGVIQCGRKNPLPFSFFLRLRSLPQPPKVGYQGKRVFKEGRNRRCLPFLPSAAGAAVCQEQRFGAHIDIFVCICYHKAQ